MDGVTSRMTGRKLTESDAVGVDTHTVTESVKPGDALQVTLLPWAEFSPDSRNVPDEHLQRAWAPSGRIVER